MTTPASAVTALSIHIGLNYVDPGSYNGWDGELFGCVNDANDMHAIAAGLGYSPTTLTDADANSNRVITEIGKAAKKLKSGDILFVSYSGHGGQVDDVNSDEDDDLDETWCLWDRQLIDDEIYRLWSQFQAGVRIVVLSDSCHSGTVMRMIGALDSLKRDVARASRDPTTDEKVAMASMEAAIGGELERLPARTARNGGDGNGATPRVRGVPPGVQEMVNRSHELSNAAAQFMAGPAETAKVDATVILISGCQDNQLSSDGSGNGLFTEKLKAAWGNGSFNGTYRQFHEAISNVMPKKQKPNYYVVGAANPAFEAESPFKI